MDLELKDKTIVVTGAANGIGAYIFKMLMEEDALPIGIDKEPFKESELENLISPIHSTRHHFSQLDITSQVEIAKITGIINQGHTREIYGLVNNAALPPGDDKYGGRTLKAWDRVMGVNARAPFQLTELLSEKMTNGGSIVNIGSILFDMPSPQTVLYGASKGALLALTRQYARALGPRGIRVNSVSPGNVNTKRNIAAFKENPGIIVGWEGKTPLRRSVSPQEVANTVLFLLSPKAGGITGANYDVNCGYNRESHDSLWSTTS